MSEGSQSEDRSATAPDAEALHQEQYEVLHHLEGWLETPMVILAFVWLALLIVELIWGEGVWFGILSILIWAVFLLDFAVKLALAPQKAVYLKRNWLTAIALLVPALRVFRLVRAFGLLRLARAGRGVRLLRVVSSLNRGMHALGASLRRRGFGYMAALTVLVTCAGAAGMYAFEKDEAGGLTSYGEALWWTSMVMTTMGSQYWPQSVEGRVLCVLLALYAFAVFGYVTATLATYFVGRDAAHADAEVAGAKHIALLRDEVKTLREDIRALARRPPAP